MDLVKNVEVTIKGDVRRLETKPGDRLVCCFRERLPVTAIADVQRQLEAYFPRTQVLVVAGVEWFGVIPSEADVVKRLAE